MKLLKSLIITCLCLFSFVSFGQTKLNKPPVLTTPEYSYELEEETENASSEDLSGTYQFQINKQDYSLVLTDELLNTIKTSRKASESVTIEIDEHINLLIPSTNEINSIGFVSLEPVVYI